VGLAGFYVKYLNHDSKNYSFICFYNFLGFIRGLPPQAHHGGLGGAYC